MIGGRENRLAVPLGAVLVVMKIVPARKRVLLEIVVIQPEIRRELSGVEVPGGLVIVRDRLIGFGKRLARVVDRAAGAQVQRRATVGEQGAVKVVFVERVVGIIGHAVDLLP